MPPPIPVNLQPYSPLWAEAAARKIERLTTAFDSNLIAIHHVGSTAVPGVSAKPILDLMPVVRDIVALNACRARIEALGYEWWGEYGIAGRRYCTYSDPATRIKKMQLHCFQARSKSKGISRFAII